MVLQIRINPFLTGQPKARSPLSVKRFSEIPDPGMSNKAGNEERTKCQRIKGLRQRETDVPLAHGASV